MDYYQFHVKCRVEDSEIILAFFSALPFESFEETGDGFNAYLPADQLTRSAETQIEQLKDLFDFHFTRSLIKSQNWNANWESNFHPVLVGHFCGVRADFHPPIQKVRHEIVINPKMAFGTGHHETTILMIERMSGLPFHGAKVLDFGCGTGILAILASKLGAKRVDAVDNDEVAFENTLDNCRKNGVENVQVFHGSLEKIERADYDMIVANINRNVILASLDALFQKLNKNGFLVISGLLSEDLNLMRDALETADFKIEEIKRKNKWLCFQSRKSQKNDCPSTP